MSIIAKAIGQPENWWAVLLVFGVFTLVGMVVGYFRGWKSALYFLIWNLIMTVVTVFSVGFLFDPIKKLLDNGDISAIMDATKPYVAPFIMIPVLVVLDLLAWIPYIFLRGKLKIDLEAKDGDYITFTGPYGTRIFGAAIGIISVMPFTVLATNMTATLSGQTWFTDINDMLLTGVTVGQYKGIATEVNTISGMVRIVKAKEDPNTASALDAMLDLISGNVNESDPDYSQVQKAIADNHKYFEDVLNSTLAHELILDMPSVSGQFKYDENDPTKTANLWSGISSFQRPDTVEPFNLTEEAKKSLESTLMELYTMSLPPDTAPVYTAETFAEFVAKLTA